MKHSKSEIHLKIILWDYDETRWVNNWWSWLMDAWSSLFYFLFPCIYFKFSLIKKLRKIIIVTYYWPLTYFGIFINMNACKPRRNCAWFSKMWKQCQKSETYLRSYLVSDRAKVCNPDLSDSRFCFLFCWAMLAPIY